MVELDIVVSRLKSHSAWEEVRWTSVLHRHSHAVLDNGDVVCWGDGRMAKSGIGTTSHSANPVQPPN